MDVLQAMYGTGLVPIFYHRDLETALEVARACAEGGCKILEFTHRGDRAHLVFTALLERCEASFPELILGVGSIGDPHTAAIYLAAGANFIVAPNLNPEVARLANRRKVPYVPGCGSATEIAAAEELGSEIVKLFPADVLGGPRFLEALRGPCPWSSLMPTGGIDLTEESVREWMRAGAACLGMGSKLISKEVLARGDFGELTRRVRDLLSWIAKSRQK
jgi:2-dehydro-3-deoxyphosphogluconate aldolase/(4S)-4-hydroxy-2-oxoglutarate aldolase